MGNTIRPIVVDPSLRIRICHKHVNFPAEVKSLLCKISLRPRLSWSKSGTVNETRKALLDKIHMLTLLYIGIIFLTYQRHQYRQPIPDQMPLTQNECGDKWEYSETQMTVTAKVQQETSRCPLRP